jgi:hypothetical protein
MHEKPTWKNTTSEGIELNQRYMRMGTGMQCREAKPSAVRYTRDDVPVE